jgi:hypothetical protein
MVGAFVDLVAANSEATRNVVVMCGYTHAWRRGGTAHGGTHGHCIRDGAVGRVKACLDEILAFWLRDERLQFGSSEGVDQASFRDDEKEDLCPCESGKFVRLKKGRAMRKEDVRM